MTEQDNEAGKLNAVPLVEECARAIALWYGHGMLSNSQSRATREFGWDANHTYSQKYADAHAGEFKREACAVLETLNARGLLTLEGVQALQMMKEGK